MNFVQVYLLTGTSERVVAKLREDVFAHLIHLSPGFYTERRTGELTSRLSADLAVLQTLMGSWISELSRQSLFLVGGIVMLALTHPHLTTTTLAGVPVVVGSAFFFGRRLRRASTGVQDRVAEAMGMADEAFSQIRTVQSFVREEEETRRYHHLLSDVVRAAIARAKARALLFGVVGFVAFAGVVAVLWQGGRLVLDGVLTPGALVSFLLYAITVAAAVGSLASLFGSYQEAVGAAQRVFELLDMRPTVPEPVLAVPLPRPVRGAVSLENVGFRYSPELPKRWRTSRSTSSPAKSSHSSVRAVRARRPSRHSFRASGMSPAAASPWTALTSASSPSLTFVAPLASSRRSRRCSAVPSARTLRTRVPTRASRTSWQPRAPHTRSSSSIDSRSASRPGLVSAA
jgi:subfamily B ATP-binding cassette protein MsbA